MLVYHGTNVVVKEPKIIISNRLLDTGTGFYTTTNREQAIIFAKKVFERRKQGAPVINVYEMDEKTAQQECSVLRFPPKPNYDWLDFVTARRNSVYSEEEYDIIIGPIANDDVFRTLGLYLTAVLSREQTIESLKTRELYTQIIFSTEKALSFLQFLRSEVLE
ncbi:MAG: DUF3990 domain-containing protein [Planctomycetia bacterium]|nr:DUF3990 domain-containing protein [Planctomycetia bacterium]